MSNPSKQKGTGGETELLRLLQDGPYGSAFRGLVRAPASAEVDLLQPGDNDMEATFNALATRPDRGEWLITMRVRDFERLMMSELFDGKGDLPGLAIEVKRYARFSLHTIFAGKFGRP